MTQSLTVMNCVLCSPRRQLPLKKRRYEAFLLYFNKMCTFVFKIISISYSLSTNLAPQKVDLDTSEDAEDSNDDSSVSEV